MRNLKKNQRPLFYATYIGSEPIKDEYGNDTLEVTPIYGEPTELRINYSSNVGEVTTEVFGDISNYSRVLSYVGSKCPLNEKDKLWIGIDTSLEANYEVIKVADSINSWLIAVGEIV